MLFWLLDRVVEWWLKRCNHHPDHVAADVLEGSACAFLPTDGDQQVQHCFRCGAVRSKARCAGRWAFSDWYRPRPLWHRRQPRVTIEDYALMRGMQ